MRTGAEHPEGMKRVLVGVDFSEGSLVALRWAARFARTTTARLQLVSAWEHPWWAFLPSPMNITPVPVNGEVENAIRRQLDDLVVLERVHDVATRPHVVAEGGAAHLLTELAGPDDTIVVGSRGHGALHDAVLGSVSTRCATTAPCPVVVVPTEAAANRTEGPVVVGLDGSANSIAALHWAVAHTDPEVAITVSAAWGIPLLFDHDGSQRDFSLTLDADRIRALDAASAAGDILCAVDRKYEVAVEQGEARRLLAEHGHEASILVVGARGRSGVSYTLLGSVATSLIHHPDCVVAVVPG